MLVSSAHCRTHTAAVLIVLALSSSLVLTGCPLDFGDLEEPEIIDVTVIPSSIHVDDRTNQDEHFTIDITIANFEDDIEEARAFNDERDAVVDNMEIVDDNVISLQEIRYTWFQGFDVGTHDVGVEVRSATESATAFRQATVTIHDEDESED